MNFVHKISGEPQCIQGTALTDSNGNFIICGGSSAASTTCPANHYCYYDGTTYGCCPTQGKERNRISARDCSRKRNSRILFINYWVSAYTCSLSYKSGASCGPAVTRWYYDSTTRLFFATEENFEFHDFFSFSELVKRTRSTVVMATRTTSPLNRTARTIAESSRVQMVER